ncbi:MAG: YfcE family phosphodiesterase, partial [Clostridia bacterium]|nr:YfcE family phosphodiesterase [Clostridia bacterium]
VEGKIATELRGERGFGYDPLFYSFELGKVFAEGSLEEKNSVGHRGRALSKMLEILKEHFAK